MSAVSNLTYVSLLDATPGTIEYGSNTIVFSNYNEAMSFAKWTSLYFAGAPENNTFVWNYNGGSGFWYNGVFTSVPNSNWP